MDSIDERHCAEASSVTTHASGRQIEIQLGHLCNNRCVFCVSGQQTELGRAHAIPLDPIVAALEDAARQGITRVTFLGGEPTMQKSFLPALRRAVELGFQDIVIFTNGVRTPSRPFMDEVAAMASVSWRFSIQGGNEEAHDRATLVKGSFAKILKGLAFLQEARRPVTANACINEYSYRSLPDYPELIARYGVRQLHIDMVRPSDAGQRSDEYLREIMPRYSDMAPYLRRMLEGFERIDPDFDVNVGNYPFCLLPQWSHKIHHEGQTTVTFSSDGRGELSVGWDKYEHQRSDKLHPPQCATCVFRPECRGVPEKYASFYGTDELQPVSLEALRAADTSQRRFALLVEPFVAPLLAAAPPSGWERVAELRQARERRLEIGYRDRAGMQARLLFTPDAPEPVFVTDRYRLNVSADAGVAMAAVIGLLEWASRTLAAASGVTVILPLDQARTAAALSGAARLAPLVRQLRKIRGRGTFAGWRYAGARGMDAAPGFVVALEGPSGGRIELLLQPGASDGKPARVDFQLGPGVLNEDARAVVGALTAELTRDLEARP